MSEHANGNGKVAKFGAISAIIAAFFLLLNDFRQTVKELPKAFKEETQQLRQSLTDLTLELREIKKRVLGGGDE